MCAIGSMETSLSPGIHFQDIKSELGIRPQCAVGIIHSFGITGRAGSIVDHSQFFRCIPAVADMFPAEIARIFLSEQFVQMIACMVNLELRKLAGYSHSSG